jgi:tryptophan-rich sensory protein
MRAAAASMLTPYLCRLAFATVLNAEIVRRNA